MGGKRTFALGGRRAVAIGLLVASVSSGLTQTPSGGPTVETFFAAIQRNDTNTVFKMLDSDTNLTHALNYGRPPLLVAAWDGHVEIVERLLKCGADVNGPDANNMGTTPLQLAVRLNRPNVCKVLLAAGADPNLQHPFDGSALHQAFEWHRT